MNVENSYMAQFENSSDDELFEIITNLDETGNAEKYTAALSVALHRELISEGQVVEILSGNIGVLNYNPNSLDLKFVAPPTDE